MIAYVFVCIIDWILTCMPRSWALKFGEGLGRALSWALPSRRKLIRANLAAAFPEKKEPEIRRIEAGVWRNIGRTAAEFVRLSDINHDNFNDYCVVEGRDHLEEARKKGKGVILVAFHFTNWEMMGVGSAFLTGNMVAIARPMKNPYVERWVQNKRAQSGVKIILHREAVKASLRVLKQKGSIGILVDQNLYTGGVFVDFFGRPAATTTLPALLHNRTKAPVLVVYCLREGGKFRLVYQPPLRFTGDDILKQTQRINNAIEDVVRGHPENWFWVHNRWKRKS